MTESAPPAPRSAPERAPSEAVLVASNAGLDAVVARASSATRLAVDVEANGLFAYRARLCTVQLAFEGAEGIEIAIVDAKVTDVARLASLLGEGGPVKVLHDLTFDAKLLAETGAPLSRVRDTSVAARLLGKKATGLAALSAELLGIHVDKHFQQHDWSRRPLKPEEIDYLAGDVRHLLALDDKLAELAREKDIEAEIQDECDYKLASAFHPPRDGRPAYARIRGALELDAAGLAVLRRLVAARESIAERDDVPPFKIIGNEVLLELVKKRPTTAAGVAAIRGANVGRAARHTDGFARAVREGLADGDVPADERARFVAPRLDRAIAAKHRVAETAVTGFRKAEAARRGIDEQAVLPGHAARAIADLAIDGLEGEALREAITRVSGLGEKRVALYARAIGDALEEALRAAAARSIAAASPP